MYLIEKLQLICFTEAGLRIPEFPNKESIFHLKILAYGFFPSSKWLTSVHTNTFVFLIKSNEIASTPICTLTQLNVNNVVNAHMEIRSKKRIICNKQISQNTLTQGLTFPGCEHLRNALKASAMAPTSPRTSEGQESPQECPGNLLNEL